MNIPIYFNKNTLRDKIHACWIGKNIGGTMGAPYEGRREMQDVKGFSTPEGTVLPNDDLDLQIVWLKALEDHGPDKLNGRILAEYWLDLIGPNWNEYGICKANLRNGMLPPMSGALHNDEWMHSNGAWIRTEIWACTNPGCVENAVRLAYEDASVDHGFGEGTYAAIFVAAMESAAFVIDDIRALLKIGLSKIPADCLVSRCVNVAINAFDSGKTWQEARAAVLRENGDLGWFQAPANIAYAVIGLLYGGNDFKQCMIIAINCGDDTDCTAATVGALLGIMHGTAFIPEDWRQHVGDKIVTVALITGRWYTLSSCAELTECVMRQIPGMTRCNMDVYADWVKQIEVVIGDGADDYSRVTAEEFCGDDFVKKTFARSPYSFVAEGVFEDAVVEFDRAPIVKAGEELKCKITLSQKNHYSTQAVYSFKWHLPEGWSVSGPHHVFVNECVNAPLLKVDGRSAEVTIVAGERPEAVNRLILEIDRQDSVTPMLISLSVLA